MFPLLREYEAWSHHKLEVQTVQLPAVMSITMPPFCSYVFRVKTKEERGYEKGVNPPLTHPGSSQLFGFGKQESFYSVQETPKIWVYSENKKNVKPYLLGGSCVRTKLLGMLGLVFSFYNTILSAWVVNIQHKLWPQKKVSALAGNGQDTTPPVRANTCAGMEKGNVNHSSLLKAWSLGDDAVLEDSRNYQEGLR